MHQEARTLLAELKACRNLERGKEIHAEAMKTGSLCCIYIATAVINMYAKCGSMIDARQVFDGLKQPDVVSWTSLISGYTENGEAVSALDMFANMKSKSCAPDSRTFVAAVKACTALALKPDGSGILECRERGKQIHLEIGYYSNVYVQSSLIDMYAKCGRMVDARQVFDGMKHPNVVSWTALIFGYVENGEGLAALDTFSRMKSQGCTPDSKTFVAALRACTTLALMQDGKGMTECMKRGKQIHSEIGCHLDTYVRSTLIDMYAKCGSMVDARQVFDSMNHPDATSWNALIMGYAENGEGATALDLFGKMKSQGYASDSITFVAALKACTSLALNRDGSGVTECFKRGKQIHFEIGCHSNTYVQSTLIDMYAKCERMVESRQVFDSVKQPNVVSWTALILGYAENGEGVAALDLFAKMKSQGCIPNPITYAAALKACSLLGALESGRKIHGEIDSVTASNAIVVTCLVDFYAKCGCLTEAQKVFDSHPRTRNMKTWTALLAGHSRLGDHQAVFGLFQRMQDTGFQPNDVTFLCILTCCSHGGLLEKANEFFEAMSTNYGIAPSVEHYNCMLDILGRSNKLDDVITLLRSMPCKPSAITWMTILGACRKWKNVEIGRLAFKALILDERNRIPAAAYVLMAHIYRSRGMWEEQELVLGLRQNVNSWKEQTSWTSQVGECHTFLNGDSKHPQIHEIKEKLKAMIGMLTKHGYVHAEKEETLCGHTEKLALVCALINTEPGRTLRIVKNLRVCDDCHSATALISKLEHRTIICSDASKFHVFKDGKCSCDDFW